MVLPNRTTTKGGTPMLNHRKEPFITRHAIDRALEMGLSLQVLRDLFHNPAVVRPGRPRKPSQFARHPRFIVVSDLHPQYALVVEDDPTHPVVVSIVFREQREYVRDGETYRLANPTD